MSDMMMFTNDVLDLFIQMVSWCAQCSMLIALCYTSHVYFAIVIRANTKTQA